MLANADIKSGFSAAQFIKVNGTVSRQTRNLRIAERIQGRVCRGQKGQHGFLVAVHKAAVVRPGCRIVLRGTKDELIKFPQLPRRYQMTVEIRQQVFDVGQIGESGIAIVVKALDQNAQDFLGTTVPEGVLLCSGLVSEDVV